MVKIKEIATIRTGYSFRNAIIESKAGDLPVIQFKDTGNTAIFSIDTCTHISSEQIKPSHFLRFNEVLVSNRGNYKSSVFKCNQKSIASGIFFILTIKHKNFLPEVIAAYLNSPGGQKQLSARQNQSGLKAIIRGELEQIDIPSIPIERQKKLINLLELYQKEEDIIKKIQQNKKILVDFIIKKEFKE